MKIQKLLIFNIIHKIMIGKVLANILIKIFYNINFTQRNLSKI